MMGMLSKFIKKFMPDVRPDPTLPDPNEIVKEILEDKRQQEWYERQTSPKNGEFYKVGDLLTPEEATKWYTAYKDAYPDIGATVSPPQTPQDDPLNSLGHVYPYPTGALPHQSGIDHAKEVANRPAPTPEQVNAMKAYLGDDHGYD